MESIELLRASLVIDFEGEGNRRGSEEIRKPRMVGIFKPNDRGKSGKFSWVAFDDLWQPAVNGSIGFGVDATVSEFESFFRGIYSHLASSGGGLIYWSQHEEKVLESHLSKTTFSELRPKLINARKPAKRYARRRRMFDGTGEIKDKSLEDFFHALHRKRHPYPPLKRGAAATIRLVDKACQKNKRWKTFSNQQKNYVSELIRYNEGDCRATWLITLKLANSGQQIVFP